MRNVNLDTITDAATDSFSRLPVQRQRVLVQQLLRHVHAYAKSVQLTHAEWRAALAFLHRVGDISTNERSEFSLLSDVTGLSSLVDMLASDPADPHITPGSNLGPFHAIGSPWVGNPADLVAHNTGTRVRLRGLVRSSSDGAPLAEATIDFWQNAANGLYWQQDTQQPKDNLRCQLRVASDGSFEIATVRPVPYQIPLDGPVWHELVHPAGLTGWRPAHYHLIVSAPGHRTLVTEVFDAEDPYLDSDAVFGVREQLVGHYKAEPQGLVMRIDFRLERIRA